MNYKKQIKKLRTYQKCLTILKKNKKSKVGKQKAALVKRRRIAFNMRVKGKSYRQIAKVLGVTQTQIFKDIQYVIKEMEKETVELAARDRQIELTRLDKMYLSLEPKLRRGDEFAIDRALKIMQQRAKYIEGYEEPNKLKISGDRDNPIEIEMAQQECLVMLRKLVPEYKEVKQIEGDGE